MTQNDIFTHWKMWAENQDAQTMTVADALRFAKHISERTNDRACRIVYGLCGINNSSTRAVAAIRKND